MELFAKLDATIGLMNEHVNGIGVTLFMPHVANTAMKKTMDVAAFAMLVPKARKIVQITPQMLLTLNYRLENPIDDDIMDHIYGKDLLAVMWQADPRKHTPDTLGQFVHDVSVPMPVHTDDDEYRIEAEGRTSEEKLVRVLDPLVIYLDAQDQEEPEKRKSEDEKLSFALSDLMNIDRRSTAPAMKMSLISKTSRDKRRTTVQQAQEDERPKLVVPPVWTPANQEGNFILLYTFFYDVSSPQRFLMNAN